MRNKKINLKSSKECKKCMDRIRIMESVLDSMSDGVAVMDNSGKFILFNPAAESILGIGKPAEWSSEYKAYFPGSDELYPEECLPLARAIKGESINDVEMSIESPTKEVRILVSVNARPLKENGKIWGCVAVFKDIERKKIAEAALIENETRLKSHTKELEKANIYIEWESAKNEALLDSIGDGLIAVDKEGNFMKINKAGEKMLGLSAPDVVGTSVFEAFDVEDKNGMPVPMEKRPIILALSEGEKTTASYYYIRKDGKKFPALTISTPVCLNKEIIGSIMVFHNIAREIEIDMAKSEFVSLASHQLRTPLSTIRWYTKALLGEDFKKLGIRDKRYVQEIYRANRRMIELVDCILNVSRIELGTFAIEPQPTDLSHVAKEVILELKSRLKRKKINLFRQFRKNVPVINADPNLIRIVFQNLISNAVKYTPERGKIIFSIQKQKHDVLIKVEDNGYGIPKHQQEKIFTKLFRADNAQELEADGTGLGLYIVKSVIEKSCGRIWFESSESRGTVFFVTIPLTGMQSKTGSKHLSPFNWYKGHSKGQLQETVLHSQHAQ